MPRQLKRRSDAISRNQHDSAESEDEPPQRAQRRQRQRSSSSEQPQRPQQQTQRREQSSSPEDSDAPSSPGRGEGGGRGHSAENVLIKKLVRLALATEYSRTPLRRSDISAKILKDANTNTGGSRASFQKVFEGAQKVLQDTFGMQMIELPGREKTSLKERRTQATQTKVSSSASSKSWVLVSTLPPELKTNPLLMQPSLAPNVETEANYTALYTFILSLIFLNASSITDQKLERYLKRVNAETYTPMGSKEKLLQRMMKEGYIDKRRDTSSGEEVIEWVPGPRGKVEVGVQGVMGLVRTVYGHGAVELSRDTTGRRRDGTREDEEGEDEEEPGRLVKIEEDELNAKLSRSLGIKVSAHGGDETRRDQHDVDDDEEEQQEEEQDDNQPGPSQRPAQRTRPPNNVGRNQGQGRGGGRRNARHEDEDDSG
ncbi:hypothetical protein G647_00674 [Cladophialophora carrionii CBS 160.54]|uniref:MAGE domain-containing protein n=1 Tax=Cladophialophora carrionii CBS 160.54 TaxID=1279043 RepID=V9DMX1_9EURO|nr:uncharacterized protein G647_00674 [Cladophialophora carrionii CBS 160.54]ETI28225.1 hypothetical protein G647_00674 [Cladophialophora carrionii CBS 160.54]